MINTACKLKKTGRNVFWGTVLLGTLLLSGCSLAPNYYRPNAPIPNVYLQGNGTTAEESPVLMWKDFFTDPGLQRLITVALDNNRDLRVAMLNIEKTRNLYRIQQAELLPTINAVANESMQHLPADISPTRQSGFFRQYSATLAFSGFELDLFGRIRNLTEQAIETYYSVNMDARSAALSLVAEVSAMYLQLVADRETLDLALATFEARKQQANLISARYKSGISSQLDLNQALASVEEVRGTVAQLKTRVGQDENYLALLLGTSIPEDLPMVRKLSEFAPLKDIPEGLPSSLLERRPDIMAAEHRLKGANANIGAARAAFFPSITLTGSLGTMSVDYAELFTGSAGTWNFLPQISVPLFDTGRNIARLRVSEAEKKIAVAQYEKTIQAAFREVADGLTLRQNIGERMAADKKRAELARSTYDLARKRYLAGIDSYITLLDAERTMYAAQQAFIATRLLRESNALTIFKALGGGWQ